MERTKQVPHHRAASVPDGAVQDAEDVDSLFSSLAWREVPMSASWKGYKALDYRIA